MKDILLIFFFSLTICLQRIEPELLVNLLNNEKIYAIDTRDMNIADKGYIPKSTIAPISFFESWLTKIVSQNSPIIIITDKNNKPQAIQEMKRVGYLSIYGYIYYEDWINSEYEINNITYDNITIENIDNIKKANEIILDVREENEYKETGIIKDSRLVSLSTFSTQISKVEKTKPVHILCKSGKRAVIALSYLEKFGFKNVLHVMEGGMDKVIKVGYPLEKYKNWKILE